jgi:hypothetical protein
VSAAVEGATVLILVNVRAVLSAGPVHLTLSAKEGPAPGTWRYTLSDTKEIRIQHGRVVGITRPLDVLVYAAVICKDAYKTGTTERRLLEQFATQAQDRP